MPGPAYFAVLQYAGGGFSGWQRQRIGRTVQGDFEAILERLTRRRVVTHAAGRTDAGVHALAQVVSFQLPTPWTLTELLRAMRALSPPDLWVWRLGESPPGFHARKHATSRRYRYVVGCDPASASPFRRAYEWALGAPLDATALGEAAALLHGEHNFQALSAVGQSKPHYRCRVLEATWQARPGTEGFIFTIEADRFLQRMVRFLVGTMVAVGCGRRPLHDVARLLRATSNQEASPPAPPQGLYFVGARYPNLGMGIDR
jgi:tRNA pseudouridine38-40 synthase